MAVRRGIEKAVAAATEYLDSISKKVSSKQEIAYVGAISANNDREIGELEVGTATRLDVAVEQHAVELCARRGALERTVVQRLHRVALRGRERAASDRHEGQRENEGARSRARYGPTTTARIAKPKAPRPRS